MKKVKNVWRSAWDTIQRSTSRKKSNHSFLRKIQSPSATTASSGFESRRWKEEDDGYLRSYPLPSPPSSFPFPLGGGSEQFVGPTTGVLGLPYAFILCLLTVRVLTSYHVFPHFVSLLKKTKPIFLFQWVQCHH